MCAVKESLSAGGTAVPSVFNGPGIGVLDAVFREGVKRELDKRKSSKRFDEVVVLVHGSTDLYVMDCSC
jgi:hypothetical protein